MAAAATTIRTTGGSRPRPTPATPAVPVPAEKGGGRDWSVWLLGAAVGMVAFVLYVSTAAHDLIAGDTPDFLIAAKTLGVPHAPGYPLLTLLGHVFSWLPVGSIPFRIGLLAVVCSTFTVVLVFATVWRLTSSRAASVAAGVALASTPLFWRWSLQMETFPLNNLLAAGIAFLLVRWHQAPRQRGFLVAAAGVFGLGLANQLTIALLGPAIAWVLWLNRRELMRRPSTIAWGALALVGGLTPYVYIPLAALGHSPDNWDYVHSWNNFVRLVERKDYGGVAAQGGGSGSGGNVVTRTGYLLLAVGAVLGVAAVVGLIEAWGKVRWYFWFVVAAFVFTAVAFNIDTNLNPTVSTSLFVLGRFFLMPIVLLAPLAGLGVAALGRLVAGRFRGSGVAGWGRSLSLGRATALVTGVAVIGSLVVVGLSYSTLDVRNDHVAGNYARDVVSELKPHTILFVTGDEADLPLLYETAVAKDRPDVTLVISPIFPAPWYQEELRHNHQLNVPPTMTTLNVIKANPGRPVAFIGDPPDKTITGKYYLYPDGLVNDLIPYATNIAVSTEVTDNEARWKALRVPDRAQLKPDSFEGSILSLYASVPYTIASAYQTEHQDAPAITWYHKTLALDPSYPGAVKALKKLGATS